MSRNKTSMKHYNNYSGNRDTNYYRSYRRSNIDEYLKEHQLKRKAVAKDGSCLFRAVGEQAWLTQATHWKLRRHCANHIKKRKDYFKSFLTIPVEDYCHRLSSQVVWGGEIELVALSQMLERDIIVYKEEESKVTPQEFIASNSTKSPILLAFTGKNHYDIVWREETEKSHGFCQSIVYDVLMERVFGETLEKPLRERMKNLSRFFLSEKFDPQSRELKQRYPLDLIHCWAGKIYENTALAIAEAERQEREVSDRRMAARLQIQQMHVGHPCDVLYKGVWYEGEIAKFHKPSQTAQVCIYHMDNGVYNIPFKDIVLTRTSTKYRADSRSEMRSYNSVDQKKTRHDGRRRARSPSPSDEEEQHTSHANHTSQEPVTDTKDQFVFPLATDPQSNKLSQPHPSEIPQPQPSEVLQPQPSEIPQPQPSEIPQPHPSEIPQPHPNEVPQPHPSETPQPHSSEVPQPHPSEITQPHPSETPQPHPSETPQPQPNEAPKSHPEKAKESHPPEKTESNESRSTSRRKKKSRRNNEANKQAAETGATSTPSVATATTTTVTQYTSSVYAPPTTIAAPEESYSSHMDAFSEAPECEWPILHASEVSRYSGTASGSFIDGPSNDDEDQLPFVFNNPGEMLMRELDPPVHLLCDDSLETRLHFMVEFAQKCLNIYTKYVRDPKREGLFNNLCNMTFQEFMSRPSHTLGSATSSCMSRVESEESVAHQDVAECNNTSDITPANIPDQDKVPAAIEEPIDIKEPIDITEPIDIKEPIDITETSSYGQKDPDRKLPRKTQSLSVEEEKFLSEFQHSYGDNSPVPNSYTEVDIDATPIISEPISEEDQPVGGEDMSNGEDDMLHDSEENYDGMQYGVGHPPMFQPGQMMPPMIAYPQPYPMWPHPFSYPPWFMPVPPMMMPAMPPYYQGPHPPLEDQMKEASLEEVEDGRIQPSSTSSSDTASPSINSQTELTESANEKEREMPESDSILLDKSSNEVAMEKGAPAAERMNEAQGMDDGRQPGRMQMGRRIYQRYNNYHHNNRGGYRYYMSSPRQHQQWYDRSSNYNKRRRTREQENK